ncbi:cytochrome c-type biogenesis protein [Rhizobium petrolearium]|uniref:cytochrome c biogenesis CcdA family protein n=1 Tax=Neorhizobium petrolearium TaxID=515361 RepID=UPI001AE1FE1A|nr:cytochrome c biogenesis protein CcdA [Neorhizobium petrolearium]MBP1847424.1 cytochrome c-type biogenesis protein [Neorhizobium petrolearium]
MLDVSVGGALLAGLLSFVSPCVLPIVPPYLAWLAGVSFDRLRDAQPNLADRRQVILSAVSFVAGFSTVFVALGATASLIGKMIAQYFNVLSVAAGVVIIVMGLHFLKILQIGMLYREARVQVTEKPAGLVGAFLMGLAFAFGWTPCVGPVLAAILFVAGGEGTAVRGSILLAAYSLGIGLPFIASAVFASRFLGWAARFRRHMRKVEVALGVFLIVTGLLFMTGQMSTISLWLLETFPAFQTIG